MNANFNQGSATIYQFPAGGRSALGGRRCSETKSTIDQNAPRVNEAACSGSWYHEEAIRESQAASKPKPPWER
jgi:hypothetical protein